MSTEEDVQPHLAGLKLTEETATAHQETQQGHDLKQETQSQEEDVQQQRDDAEAAKDDDDDDDEPHDSQVQWETLLQLVSQRIDEAMDAAARDGLNATFTLEQHDAYYRAVFEKLREEARARDDIPDAVAEGSSGGIRELRLAFCPAALAGQCPCCIYGLELPEIVLRAGEEQIDGVTMDMLLCGIRDGLHPAPEPPSSSGNGKEGSDQEIAEEEGAILEPMVTLLNFCWMNPYGLRGGLLDDTLYIYYGDPNDDSSSTRSEGAREEEQEEPVGEKIERDEDQGGERGEVDE